MAKSLTFDQLELDTGSISAGFVAGADERPGSGAAVVASLRRLIIEGRFAAGERLAETAVADALGVSRTPVRIAFRTLAQEGLLESAGKRGFVVRAFSATDVQCAVEVRGVLEGLAARRIAERGLPAALAAELQACLAEGRALLAPGRLAPDGLAAWARINHRFHAALVGAADSRVIADAIARNDHLPFASADSIVADDDAPEREYQRLSLAQAQHELVVDALRHGESARAEGLMREHAYIGLRYGPLWAELAPAAGAADAPTATARAARGPAPSAAKARRGKGPALPDRRAAAPSAEGPPRGPGGAKR